MRLRNHNVSFITNLVIIISLMFCSAASPNKPKRVLILPLNIHAEKDLSFLKSGIEAMLSNRLTLEGEVVPLRREEIHQAIKDIPEPINEQTAISLGAKYQADYVIVGSLTVFGDSISTDTRLIDVHQKKPIVIFNRCGKSHNDVIFHINLFASQINERVFGRKTSPYQPPQQEETVAESRTHPDAIVTRENRMGYDSSGVPPARGETSFSIWKSSIFKTRIKGMAVGDVDGDGRNETVFISGNKVFVYRYSDGRFEKIEEIRGKRYDTFIGVDVADINKNGKSEIFITNLIQNGARLKSFVLEWRGSNFQKISGDPNWYYRVLNVPGRGHVLLGQKRGIKDIFMAGVYELKWSNGRYEPSERQNLPKPMNIYGFTYGDVLNNGQEMIVAFTHNDHVRILEKNGNEQWESSEPYGGGATYLEFPSEPRSSMGNANEMDRLYLPQRIHIADLDKDGKNEVIVVKNQDAARRLLSRLRIFKSGHIECLTWDTLGLTLKWKTQEVSRYISDYVIADLNNDGQDELAFAAVAQTDTVLGNAKSFIVSWAIDLLAP